MHQYFAYGSTTLLLFSFQLAIKSLKKKRPITSEILSAATVKIGSFMCGGMENADRSKEVWPRTERILYFQVFQNLKDAA